MAFLAIGSVVALVLAFTTHDLTAGSGMPGMSMTHYMGLLAADQPWNLLLFMALPVVLAETLAITEMAMLLNPAGASWVRSLSHWAGLIAGPVWVFIFVHLLIHAVIPLTSAGGWRGAADVIAVVAYLLGSIPMAGIALMEAGLIGGVGQPRARLHVTLVAIFLVVSHVAMIFGMLDPTIMGWADPAAGSMAGMDRGTMALPSSGSTTMGGMPGMDHSSMPGMDHSMPGMGGMDPSTMPSMPGMPGMDHSGMTMPMATPTR